MYYVAAVVYDDESKKNGNVYYQKFDEYSDAYNKFLEFMSQYLSNFDEYTSSDLDEVLERGYECFGHGYIVIFDEKDAWYIIEGINDKLLVEWWNNINKS